VQRIIAATHNPSKIERLARLVAGLADVAPPPHDIPHEAADGAEYGTSFEAIARAKAAAWSRSLASDALVVATDGGLLVPALGAAWDPVRTRRFAGEAATNRERADALLRLAAGLDGDDRRIVWREGLAVARAGRVLAAWDASGPPGLLALAYDPADLDGAVGFWIPTVWLCPELDNRRLVDLTPAEAATRDDHWSRLGRALRRFLTSHSSAPRTSDVARAITAAPRRVPHQRDIKSSRNHDLRR